MPNHDLAGHLSVLETKEVGMKESTASLSTEKCSAEN